MSGDVGGDRLRPRWRLPQTRGSRFLVYRGLSPARDVSPPRRNSPATAGTPRWRDGIFGYHDFHSTAHELLAIVAGPAQLTLGGQHGRSLPGDRAAVLVLQGTIVQRPSLRGGPGDA